MALARVAAVVPALTVCLYTVLSIVGFNLLAQPALCWITYDKHTLIDIGRNCLSTDDVNTNWPREILRSARNYERNPIKETRWRHDLPTEDTKKCSGLTSSENS